MKKLFCVSDVHGFSSLMIDALKNAGFDRNNKDHIFVSCGDLLDRGPEAAECLKYVNSLNRKILIRGNHEDLMHDMLDRGFPREHDYSNGTYNTLFQLAAMVGDKQLEEFYEKVFEFAKANPEYKEYNTSTVNYYETPKYIFVHGWIPCVHSDENMYHTGNVKYSYDPAWRDAPDADWAAARWPNGMECWNQGVRDPDKTIVCGHWHSSWGHSKLHNRGAEFPNYRSTNPEHRIAYFDPFIDDGIIAIDACTAFSKKVNCIVLEDDIQ